MSIVMSLIAWTGTAAQAQSIYGCSSAQGPTPYYNQGCNGEVTLASGNTVAWAQLDQGGNGDGNVYAVESYAGSGNHTFSIFGTDSTGDQFCCFVNDVANQNISTISITGTPQDDHIRFWYGVYTVNLAYRVAYGEEGEDTIEGSGSGLGYDALHGGDDDDIITTRGNTVSLDFAYGDGDDDTLIGSGDAEYLDGGGGDDTILASGGNDTIIGGDGFDFIDGGGGNDAISGNAGNDEIYGGDGDDTVCGGGTDGYGGTNYMSGCKTNGSCASGDNDVLYQKPGFADPTGKVNTTGTNACGHTSYPLSWATGTCSYYLTGEPFACP